ncbi:MAG: hypothetical protein KGQ86_09715 [Bacteroidetes bacterium]|nr:hypothetical protein [Bacteroidota bacterium]
MNLRYFTLFIISNLFFLANGNAQAIPMTFHNGSLKSIPLQIPSVMNPNLSPLSDSGVDLEVGQKVFYFPNGKKGKKDLHFEVTSGWKKDTILQIHEMIRKKQLSE